LIKILMRIGRIMPRKLGFRIFAFLGAFSARLFAGERERAVNNLAIAFPQAPAAFRRGLARAVFKSAAMNCFEFIQLGKSSGDRIIERVEVEGLCHLESAYGRRRGVIAVTGHIGCWELLGARIRQLGYPLTVVARRLWIKRLDEELVAIRESYGVKSIDRDENPRRLLDVLRKKEVLGVLLDQHTRVGGIYVPFFDRPAYTPSGMAKLACITGAIVVPMAIFMQRNFTHKITILEPIDPSSIDGTKDERVERLTWLTNQALETLIRIDPKQWVWFHDRWREPKREELEYAVAN